MPLSTYSKSSGLKPSLPVHYPSFFDELPSMTGRTVVVTGTSKGLGYITALSLAKKGATLFLLNRMSDTAKESLAEITGASTGPEVPQLVECDLLDFSSVSDAVAKVQARTGEVDVLCCNAGIMAQPDEASKDGYDITASTNVLSHFLITRELMPQLEKAAQKRGEARVVTMSSGSGFGPPALDVQFFTKNGGNLGGQQARYMRYHQSKLANLVFTSALDDKLRAKKSKVKSVACTPGVCGTDMYAHVCTLSRPDQPVDFSKVPSVEDGCLAQLKCICQPSIQSGSLYGPPGMGGLPVEIPLAPPTILVDNPTKDILWKACEEAVGRFQL